MGHYTVCVTHYFVYSGTPLNRPPLGPVKVSLLEGWGEFSMLWDFSEYGGDYISGVLIREVPLYKRFQPVDILMYMYLFFIWRELYFVTYNARNDNIYRETSE